MDKRDRTSKTRKESVKTPIKLGEKGGLKGGVREKWRVEEEWREVGKRSVREGGVKNRLSSECAAFLWQAGTPDGSLHRLGVQLSGVQEEGEKAVLLYLFLIKP